MSSESGGHPSGITRRGFLVGAGAAAAGLTLYSSLIARHEISVLTHRLAIPNLPAGFHHLRVVQLSEFAAIRETLTAFGGSRIRLSNLFTYVDSYKLGDTEYAGLTFDGIGGTTSKYANTATLGLDTDKVSTQKL